MPEYVITWEPCLGGYICWWENGTVHQKIAVLGTNQNQGLTRNGRIIYEAMPVSQWGLHFTSPSIPVDLLRAIVDSVPTEALPLPFTRG